MPTSTVLRHVPLPAPRAEQGRHELLYPVRPSDAPMISARTSGWAGPSHFPSEAESCRSGIPGGLRGSYCCLASRHRPNSTRSTRRCPGWSFYGDCQSKGRETGCGECRAGPGAHGGHLSAGAATSASGLQACAHARHGLKAITLGSLRNLGTQLHFHGRCPEERLPAGQQRAPWMPRTFWTSGLQRVEGGVGKKF